MIEWILLLLCGEKDIKLIVNNITQEDLEKEYRKKRKDYIFICILSSIAVAVLNFMLAFFVAERIFLFIGMLILNFICLYILYNFFVRPARVSERRYKQLEMENKHLEQMRTEFVANVSHEIKTPLTSISGFLETLQNGAAEDPEIRTRFLDIMAIETARLKRLIEDLLVLSDIENKKEMPDEKINVKETVAAIVEAIMPISNAKSIVIEQKIEEELYIRGGEDRFRQMMVNIIENGIKYSEYGKHIYIEGLSREGMVSISVTDEGIGIEKEDLDRLFERFYRVDKSRSRKEGGTGLGLSIVKHIAVLFDANLHVESNLGKGTKFTIDFNKAE